MNKKYTTQKQRDEATKILEDIKSAINQVEIINLSASQLATLAGQTKDEIVKEVLFERYTEYYDISSIITENISDVLQDMRTDVINERESFKDDTLNAKTQFLDWAYLEIDELRARIDKIDQGMNN